MTMLQRLLAYFAILLVAFLPLEAGYAAVSCTSVETEMAVSHNAPDCGGCADDKGDQCQSACFALCQLLPPTRAADSAAQDLSSNTHLPFNAAFPPLLIGGPEPPPPRLMG